MYSLATLKLGQAAVPAIGVRVRYWAQAEPELLSILTEHLTLEPGDIVCTGTPAGTGLRTQRFMKPGDRIEADIGPLGRLCVEIGDPD